MSTYTIVADMFGGVPHISITRGSTPMLIDLPAVHHAKESTRLRKHLRQVWGEDADVIRHADGQYTGVYCARHVPMYPALKETNWARETVTIN